MAASSTRKRESKQNQREIFDSIKLKTKEVIQSRKNINNIIDIQSNLEVSCLFLKCHHHIYD
jgi:hypothetical protein